MITSKTGLIFLIMVLTVVPFMAQALASRWYNPQQVVRGEQLFAANCAVCHGKDAASTPKWRERDKDGNYPPPPLNGTAHAWHHSKKLLTKTIMEGGVRLGGKMPPFAEKLKPEEIEAVIAWVQSLWPDNIYQAWLDRGGLPDQPHNTRQDIKLDSKVDKKTEAAQSGLVVGEAIPSPVKEINQSRFGSRIIYVTKDGRYGFFGDLVDMQTGENLTEGVRKQERLEQVKNFSMKRMVIYPAKGIEKSQLTVFTDTTCPFCRKLHVQVPELNAAGVSVRYIPFPRGGKKSEGYGQMRSVWCAKDRNVAMDIAKGVRKGELGPSNCEQADAIDDGYKMGVEMDIRGTPAILLPDGKLLSGYRPTAALLKLLKLD